MVWGWVCNSIRYGIVLNTNSTPYILYKLREHSIELPQGMKSQLMPVQTCLHLMFYK